MTNKTIYQPLYTFNEFVTNMLESPDVFNRNINILNCIFNKNTLTFLLTSLMEYDPNRYGKEITKVYNKIAYMNSDNRYVLKREWEFLLDHAIDTKVKLDSLRSPL